MKLYEKKFPIYENCMISIFGQPVWLPQEILREGWPFKNDRSFDHFF